jgi:hypothetical protein
VDEEDLVAIGPIGPREEREKTNSPPPPSSQPPQHDCFVPLSDFIISTYEELAIGWAKS